MILYSMYMHCTFSSPTPNGSILLLEAKLPQTNNEATLRSAKLDQTLSLSFLVISIHFSKE